MYFLAGLMGMMALGSVAMVATMPSGASDTADEDQDLQDQELDLDLEASAEPSLFETMGIPQAESTTVQASAVNSGIEMAEAALSETSQDDLLDDNPDALPLADWAVPPMMDFDEDEEKMMVVYDDSQADADPDLDVRVSDANPEVSEIVVDGTVLATLPTSEAPAPDQVVLVGESVASEMELA
jgi:hypothetical protein